MSNVLIGLSGYARSGKDTVAKILQEKYEFTPLSFTTALNDVLLATDPYVDFDHQGPRRLSSVINNVGWERAKDVYPEVRRLQQRLGTDGAREHIDDDVWIQALYNNNVDLIENGLVAITNVRFPNELDFVKDFMGGYTIRVERPGYTPANGHISDTALDGYEFDVVIQNDGSLDDLEQKVIEVYESLIK